ncbi:methyl-accepting chemotaxis protein [Anaeromyxobacter sp. Fw109-5]|uniref:methyl-accepting chemotaxis protein n=1 Tax=Anaeromyxobacter sp. (strain Fw109-5) TaxID=404589 RepID=UPI0000ED6FAD|nr:methyl-accepting chemotaxis protein [Anaeromyxobacter sp. Fw109-5]ABS27720.1 methyl-accepting chemotaxis sensory transducer [Anaeromyxobacter sp. Fw109-5]
MQTEASTSGRDAPRRRLEAGAGKARFGLSLKIVAIAGVSTALVAIILALSFGHEVEKLLEQELTSRGRLATLTVANTSANFIFAQDVTGLEALTAATLADVPGAAYVIVRDERGRALAEAVKEGLGPARPTPTRVEELDLGSRLLERTLDVGGKEMLHVVALVTFKSKSDAQYLDPLGLEEGLGAGAAGDSGVKVLGSVELGFAYADLRSQIATATRRSGGLALVVLIGCLVAIFPIARFTTRPLSDLSRAALGIAQGDLRQDVARNGRDEVADLARSFGRMVEGLQAMLRELKEASAVLAQESDAMLGAATRQAAMAAQQSAAVAEMNASTQEIAQTSTAAIEQADRVIAVTQTAEESSRAGEGIVEEAVGSTNQVEQHVSGIADRLGALSTRVGEIGDIIGKVKDLALRSNVLALNAAIQAARTGETGASFSVIAREMRTLAEQSSATAGEVPKLLGEIAEASESASAATQQGSDKARSTAALARRAGETIGNLANVCRESAGAARQIAESSRQQAGGVNEIVGALAQLAQAAEGNVAGSEETRRAAERLKAVSGRLTDLVQRYRN